MEIEKTDIDGHQFAALNKSIGIDVRLPRNPIVADGVHAP
jgi:hypothetical protein